MQFSEIFKCLCKEVGVTQRQALAEMKLSRNSAQRWSDSWPSFEAMSKISSYFSVSMDLLSEWMLDDGLCEEDFLPEKITAAKADWIRGSSQIYTSDENLLSAETLASLSDGETKKPADQKASGLRGTGYDLLNDENRAMIDSLIDSLLKSQSAE